MILIEYIEGLKRIDTVHFEGSKEEASKVAVLGLKGWETASHARIVDEVGNLIAVVAPE